MIERLAAELRAAEADCAPVPPLTDRHPELGIDEAYAIQSFNARTRGVRIVGHKIGLTSAPMQRLLGVDQPDYGVLYADRVLASGATVRAADFIAPRVEPELAFVLGADLAPGDDVLAATEAIIPALEIVDSRIADWKIGLVDTIADNASCGAVVLGEARTAPAGFDLAAVAATLTIDGSVAEQGLGSAVLGHPASAVAWLARALAAQGVALQAGHIVMSGSITSAPWLVAGQAVAADFGPLGRVELTVT